jgi:hypothetical protein
VEYEQVSVGPEGRTAYRCVTGHPIAAGELDEDTTVESLDTGAVVRICREHGAPIAIRIAPKHHD